MNFEHVFQMQGGGGQTSYAKNSQLQEKAVIKIKPLIEESIQKICKTVSEKLVVADLGCSSGPNTLLLLSQIINAVHEYCTDQSSQQKPEIQYFLNDLPNNDFNNIFLLSMQYEKQIREEKGDDYMSFYVIGVPGSFYRRLFPSKSVHIFHSSYSVHWLSQVPKGLEEDGSHLNEKEIYINKGSSSIVVDLYLKQFKIDFSDFLKLRSKELIVGGRIILSFLGRANWQSIGGLLYFWGLVAEALNAMVLEGLVEEDKLSAFNLPFYSPSMEEVISIINMEGSFQLEQVQTFDSNWDPYDQSNDNFVEDKKLSAKNVSNYNRSILEPLIASHFGNDIIEDLFSRYARNVERHMSVGKPKYLVFILFLKLKDEEQQAI